MWVFTTYGFYSVVCARQGDGRHGQPVDVSRLIAGRQRARKVRQRRAFVHLRPKGGWQWPSLTIRARMYTSHHTPPQMTTILSVRIDTDTKTRLEALAKRARRSKSFLAAEAIAAFVEAESWQLDEIQTGLAELEQGAGVPHKDVADWLRSWGRTREGKAPRA